MNASASLPAKSGRCSLAFNSISAPSKTSSSSESLGVNQRVASPEKHQIRNWPLPFWLRKSRAAEERISNADETALSSVSPSPVRRTPFGLVLTSFRPNQCSRSRTCRLITVWLMPISSAPRRMLPWRAAASKARSRVSGGRRDGKRSGRARCGDYSAVHPMHHHIAKSLLCQSSRANLASPPKETFMSANANLHARRQAAIPRGIAKCFPVYPAKARARKFGMSRGGATWISPVALRSSTPVIAPQGHAVGGNAARSLYAHRLPGASLRTLCCGLRTPERVGALQRRGQDGAVFDRCGSVENAIKIARAATDVAGSSRLAAASMVARRSRWR